MVDVRFASLHPWALVPKAARANRSQARHERDLYRDNFRYRRVVRLPEECPPWLLGSGLGWIVRSPVDVTMGPIRDIEFDIPDDEDLQTVARKINRTDLWRRESGWIATGDTDWMRFYDFATADGEWASMFIPNGSGTVEWRLGWGVRIPDRYYLMVMSMNVDGLDVPTGVVPAKTINRMADNGGLSIAICPTTSVQLRRGDPVARLVLLHPDSIRSSVSATTDQG